MQADGRQVVVITGAARGIGLALAREYLGRGENVVATCRRATADLEALRAADDGPDEAWMRVIAMDPGWVKTDMGGPEAQIEPADSARGIAETVESLVAGDTSQWFNHDGSRRDRW